MIIVDTSALIAILFREAGWEKLVAALETQSRRLMPAPCYVEAGTVIAQRADDPKRAIGDLDASLLELGIALHAVDEETARLALWARIHLGKGFGHPARPNFGDSFSYALAKRLNAPLLFVGEDFARTDIPSALT